MPQQSVEELIRQETVRLESCDQKLADIIASPPIKTTSIGRTQFDPRTCTCETKASTSRDHADDCRVAPVLDEHAVIAAIKERRLVGESLRRLRGADRPQAVTPEEIALTEEATAYLVETVHRNRELSERCAGLEERLQRYEPVLAIEPAARDRLDALERIAGSLAA